MIWSFKKILGAVGVVICLLLLVLVGVGVISWSLFWMAIILLAGFAYILLPMMED